MESSSSRRSSNRHVSPTLRDKLLSKRIALSILDKSCAICLRHVDDHRAAVITACMHAYCIECIRKWSNLKRNCPLCNSHFDSWFFRINLASSTFHKERLPPLVDEARKVNHHVDVYERRTNRLTRRFTEQRIIRRPREEQYTGSWPSAPLPRRRSFGRLGRLPRNVIAERVLQWRTSIYDQHLQALPCPTRNCLKQAVAEKKVAKERILEKIEPWIRRELQAILCDPDPSVIVHVATSLFISSLEETRRVSSGESSVADNYLNPLQPFLLERTDPFWHELRCFAESSFNMETYDTVVDYERRPN
ncbi:hypothetical protein LguiA_001124 [Lonicera macranthoides]